MTLRGSTLSGGRAGYVVWDPESTLPELKHLGEEWAFPDYRVNLHSHPYYEFHLQLTGASEWTIQGESVEVFANMMIAVAPHQRHTMRSSSSHSQHFIYVAIDLPSGFARCGLPPFDQRLASQPFFVIRDAEPFVAPFRSFSHEVIQHRPYRSELFQYAFKSTIHLLAREGVASEGQVEYTPTMDKGLIFRIKCYINEHLSTKLCVDDLARSLKVSRSVLFLAMKREMGVTPHAYHAAQRIELAKKMLQTHTLPLTTIALDLGFSTSQHFSAAFRKAEGITPSQYRKKMPVQNR